MLNPAARVVLSERQACRAELLRWRSRVPQFDELVQTALASPLGQEAQETAATGGDHEDEHPDLAPDPCTYTAHCIPEQERSLPLVGAMERPIRHRYRECLRTLCPKYGLWDTSFCSVLWYRFSFSLHPAWVCVLGNDRV